MPNILELNKKYDRNIQDKLHILDEVGFNTTNIRDIWQKIKKKSEETPSDSATDQDDIIPDNILQMNIIDVMDLIKDNVDFIMSESGVRNIVEHLMRKGRKQDTTDNKGLLGKPSTAFKKLISLLAKYPLFNENTLFTFATGRGDDSLDIKPGEELPNPREVLEKSAQTIVEYLKNANINAPTTETLVEMWVEDFKNSNNGKGLDLQETLAEITKKAQTAPNSFQNLDDFSLIVQSSNKDLENLVNAKNKEIQLLIREKTNKRKDIEEVTDSLEKTMDKETNHDKIQKLEMNYEKLIQQDSNLLNQLEELKEVQLELFQISQGSKRELMKGLEKLENLQSKYAASERYYGLRSGEIDFYVTNKNI